MRKAVCTAALVAAIVSPAGGQELSARLDSALTEASRNGFSGIARIQKDGQIILEKGYGLANRERRIPFSPSTVVQIGSNTKDFTIVGVLQLQQKGRLSLDDPISKFFTTPADKRSITVRHLLDHTAGFPLGLGGDFEPVSRDQLIEGAMKTPLLFQPGARRNYSNTGYALLAAIIEKLSGQSYDEYVRDNILKPAGLSDTGFHLPGFSEDRLARGYRAGGEDNGTMLSRPHAADGPYWNLRGNGGMLSTVADMSRFYRVLFDTEDLLPRSAREGRYNRGEPVALAGSDRVSSFLFERDPAAGLEVIVVSNTADWRPQQILERIAPLIQPGNRQAVRDVDTGPVEGPVAGNPPAPAVADIIRELIDGINSGDRVRLRTIITARFDTSAGAPTVDERLERLASLHSNLGRLELVGMIDVEGGPVRVRIRTANEGPATMTVDIDRSSPHRIRRIGILVGGD